MSWLAFLSQVRSMFFPFKSWKKLVNDLTKEEWPKWCSIVSQVRSQKRHCCWQALSLSLSLSPSFSLCLCVSRSISATAPHPPTLLVLGSQPLHLSLSVCLTSHLCNLPPATLLALGSQPQCCEKAQTILRERILGQDLYASSQI